MKRFRHTLFLTSCLYTLLACAQNAPNYKSTPGSYSIDHNKNIIVLNIDAEEEVTQKLTTLELDETYNFVKPPMGLVDTKSYKVTNNGEPYHLYITKSPILSIKVADSLTKHPKALAHFRYYDADTTFTSVIGMDLRGNLSLTYPKKSFNIEFYQDSITKDKKEVAFKKLRKEDDWILDGLYNEPLLLRAYTSQKWWKEMHIPSYIEDEKNARSTIDGIYVDLFVNDEYRGVYLLSEKINRSLLKLKKKKGDTVRGELFKAGYYDPGTSFKGAPEFKNSLPTWAGFEMEYPFEDYTAHYDNLQQAIQFIVESNDAEFAADLQRYFNVENLIDYFLYMNAIRATDNLGKNYYIAKYKEGTPYFIVPWDMDGVMGTIQDGKRIPTTDDILSNHLFDRMLKTPTFKQAMNARWKSLRKSTLATAKITDDIRRTYTDLNNEKFYERDFKAWEKSHDKEHLEYMLDWIKKRVTYLDTYFK